MWETLAWGSELMYIGGFNAGTTITSLRVVSFFFLNCRECPIADIDGIIFFVNFYRKSYRDRTVRRPSLYAVPYKFASSPSLQYFQPLLFGVIHRRTLPF